MPQCEKSLCEKSAFDNSIKDKEKLVVNKCVNIESSFYCYIKETLYLFITAI